MGSVARGHARKQELQALVATEIRQNTTSKHATRPNVTQSAARLLPDKVAIESLNSDQPLLCFGRKMSESS